MAFPITLQNLINFAVNLVDTVMLGQLGEMPLAASSLGNQLFFIVTLVVYGIGGGANVLIAQCWGRRDLAPIYKILDYMYAIAAGFALLVGMAAINAPMIVMRFFTNDTKVISFGAGYLKIVGWSYLFFTMTTVTLCVLRSVHIVKIATIVSTISLLINVILNDALIFGKYGMPRMGMKGAAVATLTARIIEFLFLIFYLCNKEKKLNLVRYVQARFAWWKKAEQSIYNVGTVSWKTFRTTCIPVIVNELFWALGEAAVSMILGRMGAEIVSANAIYTNISELSGVVVSGMCSAACVMIGNTIGTGNLKELKIQKSMFQRISIFVGIVGMLIMLICRGFITEFYPVTETTKAYVSQIMLIGSAVELCRSIQTMNSMGVLRGAGDVKFAMLNDLLFLWGFTIPCGIVAGLVLEWPVYRVYIVLKLDQLLKIFTSQYRIKRTKWLHHGMVERLREVEN
ncbi:MATE family efflux transporter [Mediterraneibacter gnavus]|nr:MATE family efflux transporter [Mediterraneibacter gnavus]MDB8710068.1 MATE family efflux transporter [Mediterraneibacter gnavus]MDB8713463.1 MATE family efflux transporter [Mediterraneibacter gnavus]